MVEEALNYCEAGKFPDMVVLYELVSSQHHLIYRRERSPRYTVIINRNRSHRFKIETNGLIMVDKLGSGICCTSALLCYRISLYNVSIIGLGRHCHLAQTKRHLLVFALT